MGPRDGPRSARLNGRPTGRRIDFLTAGGLGARKVGAGCHAAKSGLDHAGGIGVERVAHDREHQRALCVGQTTSTGRKDQKKK